MKIHITGPLLSKSGYGVHSRQIFTWALGYSKKHSAELTVNATSWGNTGWYLHKDTNNGLTGEILDRVALPTTKVDLHIIVSLPHEWANDWRVNAKKTIGITAGVEATECNPNWKSFFNTPSLAKAVVPSQFAKDTLVRGGCSKNKILVIPEAYVPECEYTSSSFNLGDVPSHNLLILSSILPDPETDRKNFFNTLKSLVKPLNSLDGVGVVLKVNSAGRGSMDRYRTVSQLKDIKDILGIQFPITLVHGELSDEELVSLYKHPKISALFTMTRGEGFGLPIMEAAACGIPVIASDWSAHPEFLDHKFVKLKGREVPIPKKRIDGQIWVGGKWFEPDVNKASSVVKRFFADEKFRKTAMDNASSLQKSVISRYSLGRISEKYDKLVDGVLGL